VPVVVEVRFTYDAAIWERCPELVVGVVWVTGLTNHATVPDIEAGLQFAEQDTRARFPTPPAIAQSATIAAWRAIYTRLGVKAGRYPCAAESLIRRVVETGTLPRLTALVDFCNAMSVQAMLPIAPLDLAAVTGDLCVRFANGTERFRGIGATEAEPVPAGEVVYTDATPDALSRRWNWRQAEKGKITLATTDVLITTEAVHADAQNAVWIIVTALAQIIPTYLGGHVRTDILDATHPESVR